MTWKHRAIFKNRYYRETKHFLFYTNTLHILSYFLLTINQWSTIIVTATLGWEGGGSGRLRCVGTGLVWISRNTFVWQHCIQRVMLYCFKVLSLKSWKVQSLWKKKRLSLTTSKAAFSEAGINREATHQYSNGWWNARMSSDTTISQRGATGHPFLPCQIY